MKTFDFLEKNVKISWTNISLRKVETCVYLYYATESHVHKKIVLKSCRSLGLIQQLYIEIIV